MHHKKAKPETDQRQLHMRQHARRRLAADARIMMTIELPRMIGNSANIPEANEPMLELAAVTTATTRAAVNARSGMSKRVRAKATGPALPRKRQLSGMVTA